MHSGDLRPPDPLHSTGSGLPLHAPEPPPEKHWTGRRIAKMFGWGIASGLAVAGTLVAGAASVIFMPLAAPVIVALGLVGAGFSAYKVWDTGWGKTAKKTHKAAFSRLPLGGDQSSVPSRLPSAVAVVRRQEKHNELNVVDGEFAKKMMDQWKNVKKPAQLEFEEVPLDDSPSPLPAAEVNPTAIRLDANVMEDLIRFSHEMIKNRVVVELENRGFSPVQINKFEVRPSGEIWAEFDAKDGEKFLKDSAVFSLVFADGGYEAHIHIKHSGSYDSPPKVRTPTLESQRGIFDPNDGGPGPAAAAAAAAAAAGTDEPPRFLSAAAAAAADQPIAGRAEASESTGPEPGSVGSDEDVSQDPVAQAMKAQLENAGMQGVQEVVEAFKSGETTAELPIKGQVERIAVLFRDIKESIEELKIDNETYRFPHQFLIDALRDIPTGKIKINDLSMLIRPPPSFLSSLLRPAQPKALTELDVAQIFVRALKDKGLNKEKIERLAYAVTQTSDASYVLLLNLIYTEKLKAQMGNSYNSMLLPRVSFDADKRKRNIEITDDNPPRVVVESGFKVYSTVIQQDEGFGLVDAIDHDNPTYLGTVSMRVENPMNRDKEAVDARLTITQTAQLGGKGAWR
ncbi:MAG: hypothetical protein KDK62_01000 [Chlamydiia bacterium]|nr:hypothetical protein [Chlamydiia bacterium]